MVKQLAPVAGYVDGSGEYRVEREGDVLWTTINDSERIAQHLTRAPEFDSRDTERAEYELADGFSITGEGDLEPGVAIAWISGEAYRVTNTRYSQSPCDFCGREVGFQVVPIGGFSYATEQAPVVIGSGSDHLAIWCAECGAEHRAG